MHFARVCARWQHFNWHGASRGSSAIAKLLVNKKNLKNVGPIRHNEPPHAHSADVASGTVAHRLSIDVHDNDDNNDNVERTAMAP